VRTEASGDDPTRKKDFGTGEILLWSSSPHGNTATSIRVSVFRLIGRIKIDLPKLSFGADRAQIRAQLLKTFECGGGFGGRIMRAIVFCTAMLLVFTSSADAASLRDRCAVSTGAKSGAAFDACVSAGKVRSGNSQSGATRRPLVQDDNTRLNCKMTGCPIQ
jgi:hypothetical protein